LCWITEMRNSAGIQADIREKRLFLPGVDRESSGGERAADLFIHTIQRKIRNEKDSRNGRLGYPVFN